MSVSLRFKKFLLSLVTAVSVIVTVIALGDMVLRFYVAPKVGINKDLIPTAKDIVKISKYMTNDQIWKNLENFDKQAAKDVLETLIEVEEETRLNEETEAEPEQEENALKGLLLYVGGYINQTVIPHNIITNPTQNVIAPQSKPKEEVTQPNSKEDAMKDTVDRILAAATKEEIETGMAILMKVDLEKVKTLQEAGKTKELKTYIKSVLTKSEINKSVSLYNKYKHLL